MYYYLNDDHSYEPCSLKKWEDRIEELVDNNKRHVGDEIVKGKQVSTVWLGIDHSFYDGKPLLFETMVFDKDFHGTYCKRYTTWEEAEQGHKEAVQWVKDGCNDNR